MGVLVLEGETGDYIAGFYSYSLACLPQFESVRLE